MNEGTHHAPGVSDESMGEQLMIAAFSLLFFPLVLVVTLVIVLATFGKSFGIRHAYVGLLLKVFEVI